MVIFACFNDRRPAANSGGKWLLTKAVERMAARVHQGSLELDVELPEQLADRFVVCRHALR